MRRSLRSSSSRKLGALFDLIELRSHDPELKRRFNVKIFDGLGARGRFVVGRRDDAKRASWGFTEDTDR